VPSALLQAFREICDKHGILLITDEIQTGFARTGRMFGIEHSGVIGRAAVMDAVEPGGLGGTYGGSPVACAAALAVLDVIEDEGLVERAGTLGAVVIAKLHAPGLILLGCGAYGEAVRLLFPLTIYDAVLDEVLVLLEQALAIPA
jgi:4-aminobutyrate aminotransferase/(S)-3-amino-2-methylpropionate transaminase